MLLWQGFGAGFTANPWQNMIAKIIPSNSLATFFGLQSSAANLLASGGAILAGLLLERQPFPMNFMYCFLINSAILVFSYIAIAFTRESPHQVLQPLGKQPPIWNSMIDIMRRDKNFNWFLVARMIVQLGTMAFSFYTVFAATRLTGSSYAVGVLTSVLMITQVISNPLLGWLADRWSRKGVLVIGALSIVLSTLFARFAPSLAWLYPAMILAAVANTAFWTITMAMTLEFGSERERPTYVGMANTLIAPTTILAPLVGGWLADTHGYPSTFLLSAAAGLAAAAIFLFLVKDPQKRSAPA
jgi:MFS family permease